MASMLTHEEALRLKNEAPHELDRRALEEREDFLFGVHDLRASFGREWGGEFRVGVNMNVVLHFVPRLNAEMRVEAELPQFAVVPDDDRAGEDHAHPYEGWKDLEPFEGVIFYVSREQYDEIAEELATVAARYGDYARLPDTLYPGAAFVRLIATRVLEHPVVRAERQYDFSKRTF
jgi:hypothetical protein